MLLPRTWQGQVAFCTMCFDHKVPPSRIQRYMAAGLIIQLFWLRALSRRMWSTSSLLGLFNLFWCFEKVYNGAGVTPGVMYRAPDGESLAPIIRRGECDPYKTQLGRFVCVCVCVYVCMYVCVYVCVRVRAWVRV